MGSGASAKSVDVTHSVARSPQMAANLMPKINSWLLSILKIPLIKMVTYFVVRQDDEGTAARRLHDDGQELGVDRAECGVPAGLGDAYVVVALFPLQGLSIDVAEFGAAYHAERHLDAAVAWVSGQS